VSVRIKDLNGKTKATFATVAMLASFFTGALGSAYYFGGVAEDVKHNLALTKKHVADRERHETPITNHIADKERHETPTTKQERIDERVALHLAPLLVELREINRRLERMER
jgi:hypothetical protein